MIKLHCIVEGNRASSGHICTIEDNNQIRKCLTFLESQYQANLNVSNVISTQNRFLESFTDGDGGTEIVCIRNIQAKIGGFNN